MILGHRNQIKFLEENILNNKISHAYLFEGTQMLGKKKIAIEFIKALFCSQKKIGGCNNCKSCLDIELRNHPNVIFIENEEEISISSIRSLRNILNLKSNFYKVVILDNAHNLNLEASNAFLKLLEEPKGDVVFILITDKPDLLLKTILSRLQRLKFFPVKNTELREFLDDKIKSNQLKFLNSKDLEDILFIVNGRPGVLFRFIENPQLLNQTKETVANFIEFLKADTFDRFKIIENYSQRDLSEVLNIWFLLFHHLLVRQIDIENLNFNFFNQNYKELLNINLIPATKFLLKVNSLLGTNINKKLALEAFACLI